jgi:hypothetical protein
MDDTTTTSKRRLNPPGSGAQPGLWLLATGWLLLAVGCAGSDPMSPVASTLPTLTVTTTSLPDGAVDVAYGTQILTAAGGDGTYSWALASGRHPSGLSLTADGLITGTPTTVETRSFTIQVTSGDGQRAQRTLSITVSAPPTLQPDQLCSASPGYARATFEDANLEAAVRDALSADTQGALTCEMLATVERLDASALGIASLVGIQNLPSLWDLDLNKNEITDIGPLAGLSDLWFLNLNFNSLTDIAAVSGLEGLDNLSLEYNPITDIQPLSGLTGLTDLRLGATSVADYGPLGALTSLEYLGLSDNSITDVSSLSGLLSGHAGLRYLGLSDNAITDIEPLGELTSVTNLGLSGNSLSDIGALSRLTRLSTLVLTENSITDLSALSGLTTLTYVGLSGNPELDDIQPLLDNKGLGAGVSVTLLRTQVRCLDVAALRARGVTVHAAECS